MAERRGISVRNGDGRTVGKFGLGKHVMDVFFDGYQRNSQSFGDLLVAQPLGYQRGDFIFARSEAVQFMADKGWDRNPHHNHWSAKIARCCEIDGDGGRGFDICRELHQLGRTDGALLLAHGADKTS